MKDLIKTLGSTKNLKIELDSNNQCYKHIPAKYKQDKEDPDFWFELMEKYGVPKMHFKGSLTCPRCKTEEMTNELEKEATEYGNKVKMESVKNTIKKSIINDDNVKAANFDKFIANSPEEIENKEKAIKAANAYIEGKVFNLFIVSETTGVGKSHLAMSIIKSVNSYERSTLFIDIDEMLRKIKGTFTDKESKYTEDYFIDLCQSVDLLVLDDLGAETGGTKTRKEASDWTSRILTAIMNGRQNKSTIITTNLTTSVLNNIYDKRLISRMLNNMALIKFEMTEDKRIKNIGF